MLRHKPASRLHSDRGETLTPRPILRCRGGIFKMPFSDLEDQLAGIQKDVKRLSDRVQLYSTTAVADAMFRLLKDGGFDGGGGGGDPQPPRPRSPPRPPACPHGLWPVPAPTVMIEESSDEEKEDYFEHLYQVTCCLPTSGALPLFDTRASASRRRPMLHCHTRCVFFWQRSRLSSGCVEQGGRETAASLMGELIDVEVPGQGWRQYRVELAHATPEVGGLRLADIMGQSKAPPSRHTS